MKYMMLIALSLILVNISVGAPYKSILGNSSTYSIIEYAFSGFNAYDTFSIAGDTVISGINYKKIISSGYQIAVGALREDTSLGKVWTRSFEIPVNDPSDTMEILAFDYSLNIGDTFNISECHNPASGGGSIVDSVYYFNGLKHIRFKEQITNKNEQLEFIEGIGSNSSFLYKYCGGEFLFAFYLICAYKDGQQQYANKHYWGSCIPHLSIYQAALKGLEINTSPNPMQSVLNIALPQFSNMVTVKLYDVTGRAIIAKEFKNVADIQLETEQLKSGLYILDVVVDKDTYRRKVLKD